MDLSAFEEVVLTTPKKGKGMDNKGSDDLASPESHHSDSNQSRNGKKKHLKDVASDSDGKNSNEESEESKSNKSGRKSDSVTRMEKKFSEYEKKLSQNLVTSNLTSQNKNTKSPRLA